MKTLAIIPARSGSKGIPNKNMTTLAGKPLLMWTIEAAKKAKSNLHIVVTTDSEFIMDFAWELGVFPHWRTPELSNDTASLTEVIKDVERAADLRPGGFDATCILYPTFPLRGPELIDEVVGNLEHTYKSQTVEYNCFNPPDWRGWKDGKWHTFEGELVRCYRSLGAVQAYKYIKAPTDNFPIFKVLQGSDPASIDIDTPFDLLRAESALIGDPILPNIRCPQLQAWQMVLEDGKYSRMFELPGFMRFDAEQNEYINEITGEFIRGRQQLPPVYRVK